MLEVSPPFYTSCLNYAKIVILRHLKQDVLEVDTDLSCLRGNDDEGMMHDHPKI